MERFGYLQRLCDELEAAGAAYSIFREVSSNPTTENIADGVQQVLQEGCDFVVALGGGSALDAGKAIALVAANGGEIWDYDKNFGKGKPVEKMPLPLIAIPTTAGTGSEADAGFVINNLQKGLKDGIGSPYSFPVLSIVDPELMVSLPPMLTAYQGFDVLFHAMECYFNRNATPFSDALVPETVRRVAEFLPRAIKDGYDLEARDQMAIASTMAGMCLSTAGTALQHAIEHSLSGVYPDLIHGCGLLLINRAYLHRCSEKPVLRDRMLGLARAMGVEAPKSPQDLIDAMEKLRVQCGMADLKMQDFGMSPDSFSKVVAGSHGKGFYNDLGQSTNEEVLRILNESYEQ